MFLILIVIFYDISILLMFSKGHTCWRNCGRSTGSWDSQETANYIVYNSVIVERYCMSLLMHVALFLFYRRLFHISNEYLIVA